MRSCSVCGNQNPDTAITCLRCGVSLRQTAILRAPPLPDASTAGPPLFVGRLAELTRLQSALLDVQERRRSRIVLVTGEPGMGKSRLLAEFGASLSQSGGRLYLGTSHTRERSISRWAIGELVRNIASISDLQPSRAQYATLQSFLQAHKVTDAAPFLAHALGIALADQTAAERLRPLEPRVVQVQMHIALRRLLLAVSSTGPVAFGLDDLNRFDQASQDTVSALLPMMIEDPLLLVLVARDAESDAVRRMLSWAATHTGGVSELRLGPLASGDSQVLLENLVREQGEPARALRERIARRAGGNPLYIEESVRMVNDSVPLVSGAVQAHLPPRPTEMLVNAPTSPKALIKARIERLSPSLRRTLQRAAVLGPVFPIGLLQLLDGDAAFSARWGELTARQFWNVHPSGESCMFLHPLTVEVLYESIPEAERRPLHDRVGDFIEQSAAWPVSERSELLAFHFAEGTEPARAITYLIAVAAAAERRSVNDTAVEYYRRAGELLRASASPEERQLDRVQLGLGRALKLAGRHADAARVLRELLHEIRLRRAPPGQRSTSEVEALCELADVCQRQGALDEASGYLLEGLNRYNTTGGQQQTHAWLRLLQQIADVYLLQQRLSDAIEMARMATSRAALDDPENWLVLARLHDILGEARLRSGQVHDAAASLEVSIDLYGRQNYGPGMASAHASLGAVQVIEGDWDAAAEHLQRAYALHRQSGDGPGQIAALDDLGGLYAARGKFDAAEKAFESALSLARLSGDNASAARLHARLAHVALLQSIEAEASRQMQMAQKFAPEKGNDQLRSYLLWVQAQVQANSGALQDGLWTIEKSLALARQDARVEQEIDCLRVMGALHSRAGNAERAEQVLSEALAAARERGDRYRSGQSLYELGRLYHGTGRVEQAQSAFAGALEIFQALGASFDLRRVSRRSERRN